VDTEHGAYSNCLSQKNIYIVILKMVLHSLYYTSWAPKLHCPRKLCKFTVVTLQGRAIPITLTCIKILVPPAALTLHYIIQNHHQITAPSFYVLSYHCFNRVRHG